MMRGRNCACSDFETLGKMSTLTDSVYKYSPVWFQNVGISAFGLLWNKRRFGGVFKSAYAQFTERERFNATEWKNYQEVQLRNLLAHAVETVPHYKQLWQDSSLSRKSIRDFALDDLKALPILEKDSIRASPKNYLSAAFSDWRLHTYSTSGTTGTPLGIVFSPEMHQTWSAAYERRCRNWAGVDRSMSRAMLGGRLVVPRGHARPPFWRYNVIEKQLYLSAFHISPQNAPLYVSALNHHKPDYLVGYASGYFFLARFILEQKLSVHKPKVILTSSEKLTNEMRSMMQRAFGCDVFDAYSGVEACCLASECEHHRLHISPDVGLVELLNEQGEPVSPGQSGEIVVTGLLNYAQPLIRYRTGDMAVMSDENCPCGRVMPVLSDLVGRLEDTVIGADGRETVRFHGIFIGMDHIREGQIIQETLTRFLLRLVVTPLFSDRDRATIKNRFEERLGPIELQFEIVDKIERTERGKYRSVISKIGRP